VSGEGRVGPFIFRIVRACVATILSKPQYRLRVGEIRVFYDVAGDTVEVLAIVAKSEAESWLVQFGKRG
jgi:mRNA-degrading endonuclease RelE of RelBE toxin-antitoxin system